MEMGEGPGDAFPGEPARDLRVLRHVLEVVVIDELMAKRLPKNHSRDCDQSGADRELQMWLGVHDCG